MTHRTTPTPVRVRGQRPVSSLDAALKLLLKSDDEIRTQYLNLSPLLRKALRDKYLEMDAGLEQLRAESKVNALPLLLECDELLAECDELLMIEWGG